jgi:hypothetical protein
MYMSYPVLCASQAYQEEDEEEDEEMAKLKARERALMHRMLRRAGESKFW